MTKSLTGAFTAVALTLGATISPLSANELPQEPEITMTVGTSLAQADTSTLGSLLSGASDATPNNVQYNNWFINNLLNGISRLYVEDVTMSELQELALKGARELAQNSPSYTVEQYVEAVLDGVLNSLDPHSDYMSPDEWKEIMEQTNGGFVGIGVRIQMDEQAGLLKVIKPIEGGPSVDAGVQEGDYITHINGESMHGKTIDDYIEKLRGKKGSQVNITVDRPGTPHPITLTVTRDTIEQSPVTYEVMNDIGYIRITSFSKITTKKMEEAVADMQAKNPNLSGYVLDLRYNPGGVLGEAISVVDSFIDKGGIVATGDTSGTNLNFVQARKGDIINGAPLVVLVNGASASASEVVAGALQDHGRAVIMGTQTFGKGSVQSVFPLGAYFNGREDGMKITTQLYYTPSGDTIQNIGVTPDIRTEFQGTASDGRIGTSEAALQGVIANPNQVQDTHETHSSCDASAISPDLDTIDQRLVFELRDGTREADYMLLCAIEHLEGSTYDYTVIEALPPAPAQSNGP